MEHISLRIEPEILRLVNEVADARGISRSDFIRLSLKTELARLSYLPANVKKALGVASPDMPPANQNNGGV